MRLRNVSETPETCTFSCTSLTTTMAISMVVRVVLVVRMSLGAMRLVRVHIPAIANGVLAVLGGGSVHQIAQLVVRRLIVQMSDNKSLRTGTVEGRADQMLHQIGLGQSLTGELHRQVASLDRRALQDSTSSGLSVQPIVSREAADSTKVRDFVESFVSHHCTPYLHTPRAYGNGTY